MQNVVHLDRQGPVITVRYPYSPDVTNIVKEVPGREFRPAYKIWTIPPTPENVMLLKTRLAAIGWQLAIDEKLRAELNAAYVAVKTAAAIREKGDADVDFEFLTEPYAHQRAGLAFLIRLGSGALFWEMGLGKTKTAIDYAEWLSRGAPEADARRLAHHPEFRALVICPNTVKRNWGDEIVKHAGHNDFEIPTGTIDMRTFRLAKARYTIVNVESLSIKKMADAVLAIKWDLVIADESTRFKTATAKRTKAFLKLGRLAARRVVLTGTPITGKPQDAWSQLEFVQPGIFGTNWSFQDRYLKKDWFGNVTGIRPDNADELKARIDSRGYRILKSQVLDLPPKVYSDRRVEMEGEQRRAYNQMRDELRITLGGDIDDIDAIRANNVLTQLLRLTQVTAGLIGEGTDYRWLPDGAKVTELDNLLNDELAGEQVVIFGIYQKELEHLASRYSLAGQVVTPPIIYGPTPERVRHELVTQFQAGARRLLFVQSRTGGIGINLTAASTAIYTTRDWSLETYLQSQDRLHRIGQTRPVNIVHLLAEESIDDDIAATLIQKQETADDLLGDTVRRLATRILGL